MTAVAKPNPLLLQTLKVLVKPLPANPTLAQRIEFSQQVDVARSICTPQVGRVGD